MLKNIAGWFLSFKNNCAVTAMATFPLMQQHQIMSEPEQLIRTEWWP